MAQTALLAVRSMLPEILIGCALVAAFPWLSRTALGELETLATASIKERLSAVVLLACVVFLLTTGFFVEYARWRLLNYQLGLGGVQQAVDAGQYKLAATRARASRSNRRWAALLPPPEYYLSLAALRQTLTQRNSATNRTALVDIDDVLFALYLDPKNADRHEQREVLERALTELEDDLVSGEACTDADRQGIFKDLDLEVAVICRPDRKNFGLLGYDRMQAKQACEGDKRSSCVADLTGSVLLRRWLSASRRAPAEPPDRSRTR